MKNLNSLKSLGINSEADGFKFLLETLRPSLKLWDYFVNWEKVFKNTRALEVDLNLWNYLLGKENFDDEFLELLSKHPEIVRALPILIVRDGSQSQVFHVIENLQDLAAKDLVFDFANPADKSELRQNALKFVKSTGLEKLFRRDGVKNLVDYVLGVEAGLDSNGRKNRSGTSMEKVVSAYWSSVASKGGIEYLEQADASAIRRRWGFEVPVDKSSRRFDFAASNGKRLLLMEVNFYGGGGSKLKATAGEYKGLHDIIASAGHDFVWVTDGAGWNTTTRPLQEAFIHLDYLWNLRMLNAGCLLEVLGLNKK